MPKLPLEVIRIIAEEITSDYTATLLLENKTCTCVRNSIITGGAIESLFDGDQQTPKHTSLKIERWVKKYTENEFQKLFRMSPNTFEQLVDSLKVYGVLKPCKWTQGQEPMSIEKKILITLTYLGGETSIKAIGEQFGVRDSTIYNCVYLVINTICEMKNKYIVWPKQNELDFVSNEFEKIAGFPGVIGVIGVSHIPAKIPTILQHQYTNKADYQSVILQAVCNEDMLFTNVFVGYPGSNDSTTVLKNSGIQNKIDEHGLSSIIQPNFHLLGDYEYTLKTWLMVPFKDSGHLDNLRSNYNRRHTLTSIVISHTFSLLKKRWKRLQFVNVLSVDKISKVILTCCILHNFCIKHDDDIEDIIQNENRTPKEIVKECVPDEKIPTDASSKRMNIAQLFLEKGY